MGSEAPVVNGGEVVLPGSAQLAPVVWGVLALLGLIGVVATLVIRRRRRARDVRRPPVVLAALGATTAVAVVLLVLSWPPPFETPEFPPMGQLLADAAYSYRTIEDLPVAAESDRWVGALADEPLVAGFGDEPVEGVVFGMPFNPVDASTPRQSVDIIAWPENSYRGEYPIADPAYIESMPTYGFDNHYVAVDFEERTMWELIGARVWFGRWQADAGALWDLNDLTFSPSRTTASGLPILPGTVGWDEVDAGEITHVLHAGSPIVRTEEFRWPARGTDGRSTDPDAPPMGAWLRLRADADLSGLGPQARVIAEGLQRYGMVLADTGGTFGVRGTADARWDRADLRTLRSLTGTDFEVVDASSIMVDPGSMEARPVAR